MSKVTKKLSLAVAAILALIILSLIYLAVGHKKVTAPTVAEPKTQSTGQPSPTPAPLAGKDEIFKAALNLYLEKKRQGVDMSNGPCLGKIADDWVLDIAHNPRQPVDNKPQNQCQDFTEGKAHHFIELDPEGKLIRSN